MAGLSAISLVGLGYYVAVSLAAAASMYLTPASGTYAAGSTLTVTVRINTGGDDVNAVQADLTYPTNKLTFQSVDASASAFDVPAPTSGGNGAVSIARGKIGNVTGDVEVAKVKFTVLSSPGSVPITFSNSSAVVRSSDSVNILANKTGGTYTIPAAATPAPTAANTPTPTLKVTAKTPTPSPGAKTPTPSPTAAASKTPTPTAVAAGPKSSSPSPSATVAATPADSQALVARLATLAKSPLFLGLLGLTVLLLAGTGVGIAIRHHHEAGLIAGVPVNPGLDAPVTQGPPPPTTPAGPPPSTFHPGGDTPDADANKPGENPPPKPPSQG
ncbi:MAG: Cohesin domain [Candidatus Saccharibacteria bacterium]|nr:Cohesin domain [Candidatus Saccharibacteria bacterium]